MVLVAVGASVKRVSLAVCYSICFVLVTSIGTPFFGLMVDLV